jgi:hypothetical protein
MLMHKKCDKLYCRFYEIWGVNVRNVFSCPSFIHKSCDSDAAIKSISNDEGELVLSPPQTATRGLWSPVQSPETNTDRRWFVSCCGDKALSSAAGIGRPRPWMPLLRFNRDHYSNQLWFDFATMKYALSELFSPQSLLTNSLSGSNQSFSSNRCTHGITSYDLIYFVLQQ